MTRRDNPNLAINGGSPVRSRPWSFLHDSDSLDRDEIISVFCDSKWTNGQRVANFEESFGRYLSCRNVLLVSSGTAAIELSLLSLGIGPGDEVIVPGMTFPSVAISVMRCGAVPVPADISLETYAITQESIAAVASDRTKAAIPAHLFCSQANMVEICQWANDRGIAIIEDAAQAIGSQQFGKMCGTFGSIGIFSFNERKILSCGDGGCLVTDDDSLYRKAKTLREVNQTMSTRPALLQGTLRLTEFQAAVLLTQLGKLPERLDRLERNGERLRTLIDSISGVETLQRLAGAGAQGFYSFCFSVRGEEDIDWFRRALSDELGAGVSGCYIPLSRTMCVDPTDSRYGDLGHRLRIDQPNCIRAYLKESARFRHFLLAESGNSISEIEYAVRKVLDGLK